MKLSIIVPVLNEAATIRNTLLTLQTFRNKGHEVIIVDGGSLDNTVHLVADLADLVLNSAAGRARQMNRGARTASGDLFIFLHADTMLPPRVDSILVNLPAEGNLWGRFDVRLSGKHILFRVIEWFINQRSRYSGIATGDQAIFISSALFRQVGGFPEIALMEDVAFSRILKRISSPICIKQRVTTSSRRWEENGILTTTLKMWKLRLLYTLGTDPNKLARDYD